MTTPPWTPPGDPSPPAGDAPAAQQPGPAQPPPLPSYGQYAPPQPSYGYVPPYAAPVDHTPPSRTMAGWALGLSFLPCAITLLTSIGLAIAVLVQGRDGRDHGKKMAIAALIIAPLWFVAIIALVMVGTFTGLGPQPQRDGSGQVTSAHTVVPLKLRVGDCVNDPNLISAGDKPVQAAAVTLLPCNQAHDLEVYKQFEIDGGDYPGDTAVQQQAADGCAVGFKGFVGVPYDHSTLEFYAYFPQERTWKLLHSHRVTCVVGDPKVRTTGTLKGAKR